MEKILVSACLLGMRTRFDGTHCKRKKILDKLERELLIPICPEQLGGLPTPREPLQFSFSDGRGVLDSRGKVVGKKSGTDYTEFLIKGAKEVLSLALLLGIKKAYLKERSPSCGVGEVDVDGKIVKGKGVTAAILEEAGIEILGWD